MVPYCHFLAYLHAAGATFYLFAPTFFFYCINVAARKAGMAEIPARGEDFWRALGVSMMYMVAACCALSARNMRRNLDMLLIVMLSKLISTLQFIVYLAQSRGQFMYLVGLCVDGTLFLTVSYGYLQVRRELRENTAAPHERGAATRLGTSATGRADGQPDAQPSS
jgi:hypothetical protein